MGVAELLRVLGCVLRTWCPHVHIKTGSIVGYDMSVIVHALLARHAADIYAATDDAQRWSRYDASLLAVLRRMQRWGDPNAGGVELVGVLDGLRAEGKLAQEARRLAAEAAQRRLDAASAASEFGDPKDIALAAHRLKVEAGHQALCTARKHGFRVDVAPVEAEHELVARQRRGEIQYIAVNDSDYIALGGTNLLICNKLWRGEVRLWKGTFLTGTYAVSAKRSARFDKHPNLLARWHLALRRKGMFTVMAYCCVANNDFASIPDVGWLTAVRIACTFAEGEQHAPADLAGAVCEELGHSGEGPLKAALAAVETSWLMFRYQYVAGADGSLSTLTQGDPSWSTLSPDETERLRGGDVLANVDLVAWVNGAYDVGTQELRSAPPPNNPAEPDAWQPGAGTPGAATLGGAAEEAVKDPRLPHPEAPIDVIEGRMAAWPDKELQQFLRERGKELTGSHAVLVNKAAAQYKAGAEVRKQVAQIHRERAAVEFAAWAVVMDGGGAGQGWVAITGDNEKALLPTMPTALFAGWQAETGADTLRAEENAAARYFESRAIRREPPFDTVGGKCQRVHTIVEVGRSVTKHMRMVLTTLLVNLTANDTVVSIEGVHCLHPPNSFDATSGVYTGAKESKVVVIHGRKMLHTCEPCRQSATSSCVHCLIGVKVAYGPNSSGSTDGACNWNARRDGRQTIDPNQPAVGVACEHVGRASLRCDTNHFGKDKYAEITKGTRSLVYGGERLKTFIHDRTRLYSTFNSKKGGNAKVVGRQLKVASVLWGVIPDAPVQLPDTIYQPARGRGRQVQPYAVRRAAVAKDAAATNSGSTGGQQAARTDAAALDTPAEAGAKKEAAKKQRARVAAHKVATTRRKHVELANTLYLGGAVDAASLHKAKVRVPAKTPPDPSARTHTNADVTVVGVRRLPRADFAAGTMADVHSRLQRVLADKLVFFVPPHDVPVTTGLDDPVSELVSTMGGATTFLAATLAVLPFPKSALVDVGVGRLLVPLLRQEHGDDAKAFYHDLHGSSLSDLMSRALLASTDDGDGIALRTSRYCLVRDAIVCLRLHGCGRVPNDLDPMALVPQDGESQRRWRLRVCSPLNDMAVLSLLAHNKTRPVFHMAGYNQLMLKNSGKGGEVTQSRVKTLDRVYLADEWNASLVRHLLHAQGNASSLLNLGSGPSLATNAAGAGQLPLPQPAAAAADAAAPSAAATH